MSVRLNGSTSGYTELDAPAVAGNNVLKLPANSGSPYQSVRNGATPGELEFYTPPTMTLVTAVASTTGTSIDFTGIPSWVKRITVMFNGVSTNGTSTPLIQIGDAGGIENTGYVAQSSVVQNAGSTSGASYTTGFGVLSAFAANSIHGVFVINLLSGNTWVFSGTHTLSAIITNGISNGTKTISDTLTQIRITTVNGTDTFDAGTINIMYEG